MPISSNPAQPSTGGPSQTSRPNQPETVSLACCPCWSAELRAALPRLYGCGRRREWLDAAGELHPADSRCSSIGPGQAHALGGVVSGGSVGQPPPPTVPDGPVPVAHPQGPSPCAG